MSKSFLLHDEGDSGLVSKEDKVTLLVRTFADWQPITSLSSLLVTQLRACPLLAMNKTASITITRLSATHYFIGKLTCCSAKSLPPASYEQNGENHYHAAVNLVYSQQDLADPDEKKIFFYVQCIFNEIIMVSNRFLADSNLACFGAF